MIKQSDMDQLWKIDKEYSNNRKK